MKQETDTHRRVDVLVGLVWRLVVLVLNNYGRPLPRSPVLARASQVVCVQQDLVVDAVLCQNDFSGCGCNEGLATAKVGNVS